MNKQLPDWTKNTVLIYGPKKAGTTMLQNLNDGGDHIVVFPSETKFKFFLKKIGDSDRITSALYYSMSLIVNKQYPNFDHIAYNRHVENLKKIESFSLREILCHDIFSVYRSIIKKPANPLLFGMKEVGGDTEKIIALYQKIFPKGKILMIVRNPFLVTRSVLTAFRRQGIKLNNQRIIKQITHPINVLYHQIKYLNDPSVFFVSYESITDGRLKESMNGILKFLGIPYDKIHENTTIFGEPIVTQTSSRETTKVFSSKAKWYNDLSQWEIAMILFYTVLTRFRFLRQGRKMPAYSTISTLIENRIKNYSP